MNKAIDILRKSTAKYSTPRLLDMMDALDASESSEDSRLLYAIAASIVAKRLDVDAARVDPASIMTIGNQLRLMCEMRGVA